MQHNGIKIPESFVFIKYQAQWHIYWILIFEILIYVENKY